MRNSTNNIYRQVNADKTVDWQLRRNYHQGTIKVGNLEKHLRPLEGFRQHFQQAINVLHIVEDDAREMIASQFAVARY